MKKIELKNMSNILMPLPLAMVSAEDLNGNRNLTTVAWFGTLSSSPSLIYLSIKKTRRSFEIIKETKEFALNLVGRDLLEAADYCGTHSGKTVDKIKHLGLETERGTKIHVPLLKDSPFNLECRIVSITEAGDYRAIIANVLTTHVGEAYLENEMKLKSEAMNLVTYVRGDYYLLGEHLGLNGSVYKKEHSNH